LGDIEIGIDDGEVVHLFEEQEVGQSVVELVVAQRGDIRPPIR
jgi:hypothetical protein